MIVRIWRGYTGDDTVNQYLLYLRSVCLAECRTARGNRGVQVLERHVTTNIYEITCISLWQTPRALQDFYEEDQRKPYRRETLEQWLLKMPEISHYDMVASELDIAGNQARS